MIDKCDTMGGIRFCGRGFGCQSEDPFVLFWCEIHTKGLRAKFPTRPEEDEGRKVPVSKEGGRTKRTEQGNGKSTAVSRREQSTEVGGSRLLGPVGPEAGLTNVRGWISIPGDFVGILLEYTLALAHRLTECQESVTNFSLLALGANPSPCSLVLVSSTLLVVCVVFCVSVKKCEIPLAGDERKHLMIWWPWVV